MLPLRRLPGNRYLRAIRNSLVLMFPVVFVGAIALLLGSFPYSAVLSQNSLLVSEEWRAIAMLVSNASSGILALCLLVLISCFLAAETRDRQFTDISPPLMAVLALVNFFIITRFADSSSTSLIFGPHNVLPAILIAVVSTELFALFSRIRLLSLGKRTYDLDPTLHLALRAIAPLIATVAVFLLAREGLSALSFDLGKSVAKGVITLDNALDSPLPGLLLLGLINQLLWFVGLHGPHLLEGVHDVLFSFSAACPEMFGISKQFFDIYVHIGGSGSTLGLIFAILIYARYGDYARVAQYALFPALFNINELIIFGLPIIFNPIYLFPFVFVPLVQITLTYFCIRSGFVTLDSTIVPWMTPSILSGVLNSGSWSGGALQLVNILASTLIYAPFVRISVRRKKTENQNNIARILADIEKLKAQNIQVLNRHDDISHAARKLLHEFVDDLGSERVYLAYQPQHDRNGAVVGVEALLRWQHRYLGYVSPGVICALLEESQRIIPFGRWTIETACQQLQRWKIAGVEKLRVSINLSPLQLRDTELLAFVADSLRKNRLSSDEICLELTESQHVPDDLLSIETLEGLEALGIHLEMDDFGMGYSSMLYIRRFKFAAIKLDGVLTRDVLRDKNCRDIISSVVQLGEALGIRVVAEYVETDEQQSILKALGCDEFQGYLYSPALTSSECLDYLQKTQCRP